MALILLIVAALDLAYITRPLKYDERFTLEHYAITPDRALFSYSTPNNHMLHSLLVWSMTALAGDSRVAARFPTFALALISVALTYRLARRMLDPPTGHAAAALLGSTLAFAEYSINARGYTLTLVLTLLLAERLLYPDHALTRCCRRAVLFICGALVLTLPSMIVLIGAAALWLAWDAGRLPLRAYVHRWRPLIVGAGIGGLFYVPPLIVGDMQSHMQRFGYTDPLETFTGWLGMVFSTDGASVVFAVGCLVGGVALWTRPRLRPVRRWTLAALGCALVLGLAQWALTGRLFYPRNYLYLLAVLCPVGGLGLRIIFGRHVTWVAAGLLLVSAIPFQALGG
ncbi:MAG: glycosyltransferase family 39 protein [Anaerolineae bacterium]|nr:glycosyltransferase family 39 protein [Anaerolineae bacterium]